MNLRQFSLRSLFALALLAGALLTFSLWLQEVGQNQLALKVGDERHVYEIDHAIYGIHQEGATYFLTARCSSKSNSKLDPPDFKLEFSIPFDTNPRSKLVRGAKFDIPIYDSKHGNLNYFYFLGFGDLNAGQFTINSSGKNEIDGTIIAEGSNLKLRAQFFKQDSIRRSFD